jgi:hypothetical protein
MIGRPADLQGKAGETTDLLAGFVDLMDLQGFTPAR